MFIRLPNAGCAAASLSRIVWKFMTHILIPSADGILDVRQFEI